MKSKICNKCKKKLDISNFYKRTNTCKKCTGLMLSGRAPAHYYVRKRITREEAKRRGMERHVKKRYGISLEEYKECMATSEVCEICGKANITLVYDHDHDTGDFRGVLCNRCNTGIGLLGDKKEAIEKALMYFTK